MPANRTGRCFLTHGKACYLFFLGDCRWREACLPEAEHRRFEATDTSAWRCPPANIPIRDTRRYSTPQRIKGGDANQLVSSTDQTVLHLPSGKLAEPTTNCTTTTAATLFSLWDAERPERLVRAPGLGVLNQCLPGRVASLCAGKFLGRNHGAVCNAEPTNDD